MQRVANHHCVTGVRIVDALRASLDGDGRPTGGTVAAVTSLVLQLADGVRRASKVPA